MNKDKIIEDHARKSKQVRELKKTVKRMAVNKVSIVLLKQKRALEVQKEVDARDYQGWDNFDDEGYARAVAKREARIELLNELIREAKTN